MSIPSNQLPTELEAATQARAWRRVEQVILDNFHKPDIQAIMATLACAAAHRVREFPPAWPLLIAPPGSMKTALVEGLQGLPRVYFVDKVTPGTFISGQLDKHGRRKKSASLLHRIGPDGVLICPDFSTMLSGNSQVRDDVFSQLRRIYDGHYSEKGSEDDPSGGTGWTGRLTYLAGVTPTVDEHQRAFGPLAERFIRIRWQRASGDEAGLSAMKQTEAVKNELREALHALLLPFWQPQAIKAPELSYTYELCLAKLGEFTVRARAHVPRDNNHKIDGTPQIESNTRLPQQQAQVARGWAAHMGHSEVGLEHIEVAERTAYDSIPPVRRAVIEAQRNGKSPHSLGIAKAVIQRAIEDLREVGIEDGQERFRH